MSNDTREKEYLVRLQELHQRRLQLLQEQEASKGANTPPETIIEIEDIQKKLSELTQRLSGKPLPYHFSHSSAPKRLVVGFITYISISVVVALIAYFVGKNAGQMSINATPTPLLNTYALYKVEASQRWVDTGINIPANIKIDIQVAEGSWSVSKGWYANNGNGYPDRFCKDAACPARDKALGGLVAQIGVDKYSIGNGCTLWSERSGEIKFMINDNNLSENTGSLYVKIAPANEEAPVTCNSVN